MYKYIFIALIFMLLFSCSGEQTKKIDADMKEFIPNEINGWQLQDIVENYDRQTIFSYINGAGEVYRAYDFSAVSVFRYAKQDAPEITVEIFDMGKDEDAYGVFSYSRESELSGIGNAYEHIGSVICFWQSKYYICIRADEKTDETNSTITELAKTIDKALPQSGNIPELIKYLPEENLKRTSIRYLHTHSALNYHYYFGSENVLNVDEKTNILLAEYKTTSRFYVLVIEYLSNDDASNAYYNYRDRFPDCSDVDGIIEIEPNKWTGVDRFKNYLTIVLDVPDRKTARKYMSVLKLRIENI